MDQQLQKEILRKKYFIVDGEQIEKKKKRVFLNGFHFENNSFIYCIVVSMWNFSPQKSCPNQSQKFCWHKILT